MGDFLKHECGIAFIRLRQKGGDEIKRRLFGLQKLAMLMYKQEHRGQDGAGIVNMKLNMPEGTRYIDRIRSDAPSPLNTIFREVRSLLQEEDHAHTSLPFSGEIFLGHLRYGTYGGNSIENCHPFIRSHESVYHDLAIAGNFNLTNTSELTGQQKYDLHLSDTAIMLQLIGQCLDREVERVRQEHQQVASSEELTRHITQHLDIQNILQCATHDWDGGYVIAGITGSGHSFIMRDPSGIRPAYHVITPELVAAASERPALQTTFNVSFDDVKEIAPGHALIIDPEGGVTEKMFAQPLEKKSCAFERIYFSRGNDRDIYEERRRMGQYMGDVTARAIGYDFRNTLFTYIPHTAETAFRGLTDSLEDLNRRMNPDGEPLTREKLIIKETDSRTFITEAGTRDELAEKVYDLNYGALRGHYKNIVIVDDSIVRGNTLQKGILKFLPALRPEKVIVVSSAPQIRYPDCYGIDLADIGDLIAFRAAFTLLQERGLSSLLDEAHAASMKHLRNQAEGNRNELKKIYDLFTYEEISDRISSLIRPEGLHCSLRILFQRPEDLRRACPDHRGDWCFTGDYPTPGGYRVANRALMHFIEGHAGRAYH
jgi:amidophosphoribosyltransferase